MIPLSPSDLNRRIVTELDRKMVTVTIAGFDQDAIFVNHAGGERVINWGSFEWEEVAKARDRFQGAGLRVRTADDGALLVSGESVEGEWKYWARGEYAGQFARPSGTRGAGGEGALLNAMRGGTVPAVMRAQMPDPLRDPQAQSTARDCTSLSRAECIFRYCPHPDRCREGCVRPPAGGCA